MEQGGVWGIETIKMRGVLLEKFPVDVCRRTGKTPLLRKYEAPLSGNRELDRHERTLLCTTYVTTSKFCPRTLLTYGTRSTSR